MKTVLITGNTFPVKDQLKALGGRWNAKEKGWDVPEDKVAIARVLVAEEPGEKHIRERRTGCRCGSVEGRAKKTDCAQCIYDAE